MAKDLTPKEFKCTNSFACPGVFKLEPEDLTPEHLRCAIASCPSVTAVAGDLLIVGKRGDQLAADLGKGVGDDEYAIVIERGLLDKVLKCQASAAETGTGSAPSAFQSGVGEEALKLAEAIHENLIGHMNTCIRREQDASAEEFRLMAQGVAIFLQQARRPIEEAQRADTATAEQREASLTSEIARLREALKPFARWADILQADTPDDQVAVGYGEHDLVVRYGDIRAARTALSPQEAPAGPGGSVAGSAENTRTEPGSY